MSMKWKEIENVKWILEEPKILLRTCYKNFSNWKPLGGEIQ